MDMSLFKELKDSRYKYPDVSTLVSDPDILLAIYLDSLYLPIRQLSIIWSNTMVALIMKYFKEIFLRVETYCREKNVEFRLVVESRDENEKFLKLMRYCNKRYLDNITESLQISDDKVYVKPLSNTCEDHITHIVWSNSQYLISLKQQVFDSLWKIARPMTMQKM